MKGRAIEPQATHGLPSLAQGFLPCGQSAIRFLLACPRLGKSSEAQAMEGVRFRHRRRSAAGMPLRVKEGKRDSFE
jgi:hypothetical protein